ncbi:MULTISPECIES: hypothetical protein [Flavobacterium]|jgi:hypothetical protein|uniref:DUF4199 domain-containing protein n=1 Tax=Flavobacterium lindanitolerans TaxID=428988 RepID=A0A497VA50_9FLAO|nr:MULTISPECIES: hypothetical protein [Flavobacterium]MBU7569597.1 hypothetical protein [Flavobacterium sp.]PZO22200.1 MAG: hypothetical protein DCE86_18375 [Flavobacteriaceae bacterium]THD33113.1 MAG: hypothetical protein DI588_04020 [Flavobacterium johnsoniae]MBC8643581.1 hypothetical protein [Flavobacterium lindanitolerans]MDQ7959193.1 hypothetical protein [Flavobacterium lindanitolerans]
MKVSRLVTNGVIIFIGLGLYFLLIEALDLKDHIYLRLVNFIFVIYGVNKTIKSNYHDGINGYLTNLLSGFITAMVGLILGLIAFMIYVEYRGGNTYLESFADSYIFGGGDPSLYQFCFGLFIEGSAASMIVSFAMMQYWKDKVEKINKVD